MGSTNVEFLDDRVRVHYYLQREFGIPDEYGVEEVMYDSLQNLPKAPQDTGKGFSEWRIGEPTRVTISLPEGHGAIVFVLQFHQERGYGPSEEDMYGPYIP